MLNKKQIEKLHKSLSAGFGLEMQKKDVYFSIYKDLHDAGIAWGDFTSTIIASYGSDWPHKPVGKEGELKPVGYQAAMKDDDPKKAELGRIVNVFVAYKGKFKGLDENGVPILKDAPSPGTKGKKAASTPPEDETPELTKKKEEERKSSQAFVFDRNNLETMLIGIFGMPEVQKSPELTACAQTLIEGLGFKLPELPEVKAA